MSDVQDRIDSCKVMAENYRGKAERLEAQYSGVRPGWVSAELAIAWEYHSAYAREAARLEAEMNDQ